MNLVDWLRHNGGYVHPELELFAQLPNGDRGVVAKSAIKEGEKLLLIPKHLCMYVPSADDGNFETLAAASPALKAITKMDPKTSGFMATVLMLMAEKAAGPSSRYASYWQSLPEKHDSLIVWSNAELAQLKGTALEDRGTDSSADVFTREIAPLISNHPEIWPPSKCDVAAFTWALGMVQSRAFHLVATNWLSGSSTQGTQLFMLPAIDMLNHTSFPERRSSELQLITTPVTIATQEETPREVEIKHGFFSMKAERDISQGEEVIHTYGDLSDSQLLQTFGFVEDAAVLGENPNNTLFIPTGVVASCAAEIGGMSEDEIERRLNVLRPLGLVDLAREVPSSNPMSDALLTVAQVLLMPEKGFEVYQKEFGISNAANDATLDAESLLNSGAVLGAKIMEDDPDFAFAVCMALLKAVQACQRVLDEPLDADSALDVSAWRAKCAAQVRQGQKDALGRLKAQLTQLLCSLQDEDEEDDEDSLTDDSDSEDESEGSDGDTDGDEDEEEEKPKAKKQKHGKD